MKVILFMAMSVNGMIATKTGSEEFLSHDNWIQFIKLVGRTKCFIWGRKTYEAVCNWEGDYLKDVKDVKKIVVSHSNIELQEGFALANSPEKSLEMLSKDGFAEAVLTGGATVNSEFAKRGLIDEVVLVINPTIIGEGIPLMAPESFQAKLSLAEFGKVTDDIFQVRYRVIK